MNDDDVLIRVDGILGHITLNRPRALNALNARMIEAIDEALTRWEHDPDVRGVLIDGAGGRGLCAGGDIRFLAESARAGTPGKADAFLRAEYHLNARIAHFPKPYIALMDGMVMGGGVGLSAHGALRIVTDTTRLAMPEVAIGFVPDIGGTHLMARAPGELGTHMALTADSLGAADAILCGFADRHVPSDRLGALTRALTACTDADTFAMRAAEFETPPKPGTLTADAEWINACYAHDDVPAIVRALRDNPNEAAQRAAGRIVRHSPISVTVTLRALRDARRVGKLELCLELEYRLALALLREADFFEGVRAAVIDKDRNPAWSCSTLVQVSAKTINALFAFMPARSLDLTEQEY